MDSMTGFGTSKAEIDEYSLSLEVKSVNGRYLNINIKAPKLEGSAEFEDLISRKIKSNFKRGSFDVYFSFGKNSAPQNITINEQLADQYFYAIEKLRQKYSFNETTSIKDLLSNSDIFQKEVSTFSYTDKKHELERMIDEALKGLKSMRETEGKQIESFYLGKLEDIKKYLAEIEEGREEKVGVLKEKMTERIKKVFEDINIDENRMIQEIAFIIDKTDIQEEVSRLKSHLEHFQSFFDSTNPGKKLEFLLQEMNREINTIGSKGNDFGIACSVAEAKSILEAMREQVFNLE